MRASTIFAAALSAAFLASPGLAGEGYTAMELLSPCQEADNDARWGQAAEMECEQYIVGFVDALEATGEIGAEAGICLPDTNVSDEVRWAFMRWIHGSYSTRTKETAAVAMMETMKDAFPCSN